MRAIVIPGSKHGATTEVAEAIAAELRASGVDADVWMPDDVRTLENVDAAVIGSGVYAGRWLSSTRRFIEDHREELRRMPVWLFSVGPVGAPAMPAKEGAAGDALARQVQARQHRVFAGRIDKADLSVIERVVVAALRAPQGDYRDWDAIRAWAREIAAELRQAERAEDFGTNVTPEPSPPAI